MVYLLDADVFIQAKNTYYRFEFCPAFWDWIKRAHDRGAVYSVRKVRDQLLEGRDELSTWAMELPSSFFWEPGQVAKNGISRVGTWVDQADYDQHAKDKFIQDADHYLVGTALAEGCTVVTHEVPSPGGRKKIKIPDVCAEFEVKCITMFDLLQKEGARFVLDARADHIIPSPACSSG